MDVKAAFNRHDSGLLLEHPEPRHSSAGYYNALVLGILSVEGYTSKRLCK
jgi:hypothetical protein